MNNSVLGTLAGIAIGTIVGMLIAPDKGSKTRKKIAKKGKDTTESLKEELNTLLEKASEKYDVLKSAGNEIAQTTKAEMKKVKQEVKS
ncbi:YtxH domain-containing protein [uncultured Dokdonia sp.]|uniref:YtxH domain-containing protein n=1 Tax=uncultured Dokdonia sp. TaxID=575653 RepID=UPI0026140171|nr:YtxH domain-containing protein [uncultured Dokdonia sp.]